MSHHILVLGARTYDTITINLHARRASHTHDDLERFLDLLYGLFSDAYTASELHRVVVSDPFDRSEHPRQLKLVELTDWLEAIIT